MFRFVAFIEMLLVGYDQVVFDGKYVGTAAKIARTVLVHFGV